MQKVYIPDLLLVASYYKDWATLGAGVGNFLSYGDFPHERHAGTLGSYWLPQGIVLNRNLGCAASSRSNHNQIKEYVTRSWYSYTGRAVTAAASIPTRARRGPTIPGRRSRYQFLDTNGKYSWLKAPRYNEAADGGRAAGADGCRLCGRPRPGTPGDQPAFWQAAALRPAALFSTLGRVAARGIETLVMAEQLGPWIDQLAANLDSRQH